MMGSGGIGGGVLGQFSVATFRSRTAWERCLQRCVPLSPGLWGFQSREHVYSLYVRG